MSTSQKIAIDGALAVIRSLSQPHLLADRSGRVYGCNPPALKLLRINAAPDNISDLCRNPEQLRNCIAGALRSTGRYPASLVGPDDTKLRAAIVPFRTAPGAASDVALIAIRPREEANHGLIQLKAEIAVSRQRQRNLKKENRTLRHTVESVIPTLQRMAFLDGLTSVGNKRFFDEQYAKEWGRATREQADLALLILDVDHFKRFNDRFGHAAGDEILADVAGALQNDCRRSGDLVCRVGGEEFAILAPNTDIDGAMTMATSMNATIAGLLIAHPDSDHGILTVSIGVGAYRPAPGDDRLAFYKQVDRELYAAKAAGRNRAHARADDGQRGAATLSSIG